MPWHSSDTPRWLLLVVPTWPPAVGGLGLAARRLAQALAARGIHVLVILPEAGASAEALRLAWPPPWARPPGQPCLWPASPEAQGQAMAALRAWVAQQGGRGLVQAVFPSRTGGLAEGLAGALGCPWVVSLRGQDLDGDASHPERGLALRRALCQSQGALAVSRAHRAGALGLGAPRAWWSPNGVDLEAWRPRPRTPLWVEALGWAGPPQGPVVAFVGELRAKKDPATLMEAFARLHARDPGARFLSVGALRPEARAVLASWARRSPSAARAWHQLPWLPPEELASLLAWAQVAWHPSLADGLPNAALEACALGLPLLATPVGGLRDLLEGGPLAAWQVPVEAPAALAEATWRLARAPALRRRLGAEARVWVGRRFGPGAEVAAHLQAYAELLRGPVPRA